MTRRPFRWMLILIVLLGTFSTPALARDRDPLAPITGMEAHEFEVFPPEVVTLENAEAITTLVNEARQFGVPVSVRIFELPIDHEALPALSDLDPNSPIPVETVQQMAEAWMTYEPIESSPGAEDGFLLFVVVPRDPRLAVGMFEQGPNALPLNGLTQENIDAVVDGIVMPGFAGTMIIPGIQTSLRVFSYNNLFGEPERLALDGLHQDLQLVAGVPLAGVTALSGLSLLGLAFWIHRRPRPGHVVAPAGRLSPLAAAALHEGRVSDAVVTGGLLHLVRIGALVPGAQGQPRLRLGTVPGPTNLDPFTASILDILGRNATDAGEIHEAAARRLHDLMQPTRAGLEDDLARRGLLNRDGRVETVWLVLASALVAVIALFTLLPSILGMARFGIFAFVLAIVAIVVVLVWGARRSWTTGAGEDALQTWLETAPIEERATFDTVANQDALINAQGGPMTPGTVSMVRTLRGLGAT